MSITVRKKIRITVDADKLPYDFSWSSDSCVSFSPASGTSDEEFIQTDITFTDETCLNNATITLDVTDYEGCTTSSVITVTNPCDSFVINDIIQQENTQFYVSGSVTGCSNILYEWSYDDVMFNLEEISTTAKTSTLHLSLNCEGGIPSSSNIYVRATDTCNGCTEEKVYAYAICIPDALNYEVQLTQTSSNSKYTSPKLTLDPPIGCPNQVPDWNTLEFETPANITIIPLQDADGNNTSTVSIVATNAVLPGVYIAKWSVSTAECVRSNKGTIIIKTVGYNDGKTLSAADRTFYLPALTSPGDIFEMDISNEVLATTGTVIDWDSWQLGDPPSFTSPSITLAGKLDGSQVIQYEVPTVIVDEAFGWTICDTNGNCSMMVTYTVLRTPSDPIAVDDAGSVTCGTAVTLNILSNDLGNGSPLDITSIKITQNASKGLITNPNDGTLIYTANAGESGSDTFKYTVRNAHGNTSNEATVTMNIACSGADVNITLCN